ncbi:hypothetical protein GCM10020358_63590 [Amorphoplanes nipponensis]|uniref:Uncharacterized protein n=1 Tax=Actinoplanes nipponensis TaxID=135950 RepID=A0A919MP47_9ACTN|nr:hypothetical protein [Actinoplanes nipponensis]GIE52236.1 hypothetical protein Ani05nite_57700 [Actinoplanes nipponensis]
MTSTPPPQQPPHPPVRPVVPVIRPLRDLTAYALVAAPAIWLFVAVIRLIPSGVGQDFLTRVQNSFYGFVNLEILVLPLAAVLLATMVQPVHRHAKLITIAALVEYAVAAFFAVVFGFLIALVKIAGWSGRVAFEEFLVRAAWLAVFAAAGYAVFLIWRNLFYTPKPKAPPGMYGQPQQWQQQQQPYGQPGYQQQPGYPPPAGYGPPGPAQPQPGQTQPLHQHAPQPGPQQPAQWGQPPAAQGWAAPTSGQQTVTPSSAPPASAPPVSGGAPGTPPGPFAPAPGHPSPGAYGQPAYPPPGYGQPQQPGGHADPTQAIPHRDAEDADRTRIVGEEPPPRP